MQMWSPWHGCKKISEGCENCYMYYLDKIRDRDGSVIYKTQNFYFPISRNRRGDYVVPSGATLSVCMSSDFFLEEADEWRSEAWEMMRQRSDVKFFIITKRVHRIKDTLPADWGDGYENVVVCCTVENQINANHKLQIFSALPIKHKCITAQPLLEQIDIEKHLDDIELVVVGGESDRNARPLDYSWVLYIREQCIRKNVSFEFRQCGTHFIKDSKEYKLQTKDLCSQARKAGINFRADR